MFHPFLMSLHISYRLLCMLQKGLWTINFKYANWFSWIFVYLLFCWIFFSFQSKTFPLYEFFLIGTLFLYEISEKNIINIVMKFATYWITYLINLSKKWVCSHNNIDYSRLNNNFVYEKNWRLQFCLMLKIILPMQQWRSFVFLSSAIIISLFCKKNIKI